MGFTLVELLVVIAILAILATVSIVGYTSFINNANNSVAQQELTQIRDYYLAGKYLTPPVVISEELTRDLGLEGRLEEGKVNGKTCYRYTSKGTAYWFIETNEVVVSVDGWKSSKLSLEGLNVLCLGDSITAGQGLTTDTRWTNVLASKYNWTLTNRSLGGISLSSYYYTYNSTTDESIAKKAEILKTMTTPPDIIIVWGGHNDESYRASPLGTWEDEDTNSFKGALKYIASLAHEYAPNATLFVLTPMWTHKQPVVLKYPQGTTDTNRMFNDAVFEGAEKYGWIPINMDFCGINPDTLSEYTRDGIHPNDKGTEKIVEYLSEELASYGKNSQIK